MADMIARLKVDSSEYDSKVKRAAEGILSLERTIREAGESFLATWKEEQNFAKGLGQMETVSKTARGKISELTSAFTEMSLVYKRMTDEEKNSPFGRNLAASIEQLKGRITDAKKDLADVNRELGETGKESQSTGNILDQLAGKFGINTKALTTWGVALGAGAAALKVAKDAFFASEQNLDDWNRMVYSSQSTYEAFLTSLNTGDVSGFLNNINTIVKAANDAYDAIDRLQTTQNIQTPQVAKRQAELQRMETMLRTGRYIAPIDGRPATPGLNDGDKLTKAQKDRVANQVENIIRELAGLTKKEVNVASSAIDKLFNNQALRLGMTKQQFLAGTANIETFEQNVALGKKYQEWEANRKLWEGSAGEIGYSRMLSEEQKKYINTPNPYQQYKGWSVFKDDGDLYQSILTNIKNRTAKEQEYYAMLARSYRQINRVEGYSPYGKGGKSEASINGVKVQDFSGLSAVSLTESKQMLQEQLKAYQQMLNEATNMFTAGVAQKGIEDTQRLLDAQPLALKMGISADAAADIVEKTQSLRDFVQKSLDEEVVRLGIELNPQGSKGKEDKEKEIDGTKQFRSLVGDVSTIVGSLNQLGIDVPEGFQKTLGVMQVVTTILMTLQSLAGITAATSAVKSIPIIGWFLQNGGVVHAADGWSGIVPGTHMSGDQVPAMLNSGELVLNKAQSGVIAAALTSAENGSGGGVSETRIESDQMVLLLRNGAARRGQTIGEYLGI